jgi:hypothetical protein
MRVCWRAKIMGKGLGEEEPGVGQGEEVERGEEVQREVKEEVKKVLVEEDVDEEDVEEGAVPKKEEVGD